MSDAEAAAPLASAPIEVDTSVIAGVDSSTAETAVAVEETVTGAGTESPSTDTPTSQPHGAEAAAAPGAEEISPAVDTPDASSAAPEAAEPGDEHHSSATNELVDAAATLDEALATDAAAERSDVDAVAEAVTEGAVGDSEHDLEQFAESVDAALQGTAADNGEALEEEVMEERDTAEEREENETLETAASSPPFDYAAQAAADRLSFIEARDNLAREEKRSHEVMSQLSALFSVRRAAAGAAGPTLPALMAKDEKRLYDAVEAFAKCREASSREQADHDTKARGLQQTLESKEARLKDVGSAFLRYKREVSRVAGHSVTGKRLPSAAIAQYISQELEVDAQLAAAELRFIAAEISRKKIETARAAREALTAGMTQADFEQLRAENSLLNEKIEARKDEYNKSRKKATLSVVMLSHVREKLHAVAIERGKLLEETSRLDAEINQHRTALTDAKRTRDAVQRENAANFSASGFVFNDRLCIDFAATQREIDSLRAKLLELQGLQRLQQ